MNSVFIEHKPGFPKTVQFGRFVENASSTDGSRAIASGMGSRVVHVETKGYGNALMGGIAAGRGEFIIMGDADNSYDFGELFKFVEKLRARYDLVQGCRLPSGAGTVMFGAMPFLHRWWGNPMFSFMAQPNVLRSDP
jgi:glycosyltransferase involved in cell wall biosynthesis